MLARWNPLQDVVKFDKMFDQFWNNGGAFGSDAFGTFPAIDMKETGDAIVIHADVPGFTPEQIDVHIENGVLFLKGEREVETQNDEQYHVRERQTVKFQRAITLPSTVEVEKAQAEFDNGILTLNLPKAETARAKKINIMPKHEITAQSQS